MSAVATVLAGYQTVLPPSVVEALGVKSSSQIVFEVEDSGRVTLSAKSATFASLVDRLPKHKRKKAATDDEIASAIKAGAAKRYRKSQS